MTTWVNRTWKLKCDTCGVTGHLTAPQGWKIITKPNPDGTVNISKATHFCPKCVSNEPKPT